TLEALALWDPEPSTRFFLSEPWDAGLSGQILDPPVSGVLPLAPWEGPGEGGLGSGEVCFHFIFPTTAPDYDRSQWLNEKFKLGLDFPNLPYLIDGTHKITQSNAILRYIARKHNLCGETEEEKILVDILENQLMDSRMEMVRLCFDPNFEKLKPKYLEELPEKLKLYSQFLGKRPWFTGDKITFVDFLAYDVLDMRRIVEPGCLDAFPNLKDFISRFEGLKKISAYMKSSRFHRGLLFGTTATWNST
uniref:Glutathione S-transferase n=1 Tax=Macaca fascicularis TaxID=9541 RepID=A0A2K5WQG7_MACFA